jgi:hypothetical protein
MALTLSPNGRYMILNYKTADFPASWRSNPYVRWCASEGIVPDILGLYDFKTGRLELAFDSPGAGWRHPVVWASDSMAFGVNALSPLGSRWETEDMNLDPHGDGENRPFICTHTFAIDLRTHRVT